jgi:UDP-N-acetylglucosamine--N-acetylmuramyl-(pentapeptide) pyrophosphoryl-undecaprenol N-acetylglucosamine transferase
MPKRILIATGGTGGHIYPAMALAQQYEEDQILFIGGGLSQNRYFDRTAFDHRTVACGAFTNKSPLSLLRSCINIARGIWQSCKLIREFKPDIAVGFGSYYSFPPLIAAKLLSVPIVLHEANSIPGKVNRLLSPYALAMGVHFPKTMELAKGNRFVVGMPLRKSFRKGNVNCSEARSYFGLPEKGITLLVFGGSQGAQVINRRVLEAMRLLRLVDLQIIHVAGDAVQARELVDGYEKLGIKACVKPFEERMDLAWGAADFVISRSGAGSIAEQLEFEVPGILIPFARAADDHQNHNADFLVDAVGGARKIQENELSPEKLAKLISEFLDDDGKVLEQMKWSMAEYKLKARQQDLYGLINGLLD